MYKYKRVTISLDEDKIRKKYNSKIKMMCKSCSSSCKDDSVDSNIFCINEKWNVQKDDGEQGFDSDCFNHCCRYDICLQIFQDTECHKKGHMKTVIIEFNEIIPGFEKYLK